MEAMQVHARGTTQVLHVLADQCLQAGQEHGLQVSVSYSHGASAEQLMEASARLGTAVASDGAAGAHGCDHAARLATQPKGSPWQHQVGWMHHI